MQQIGYADHTLRPSFRRHCHWLDEGRRRRDGDRICADRVADRRRYSGSASRHSHQYQYDLRDDFRQTVTTPVRPALARDRPAERIGDRQGAVFFSDPPSADISRLLRSKSNTEQRRTPARPIS